MKEVRLRIIRFQEVDEGQSWHWGHMTDHIIIILQLPFFLDASSVEHAKFVRRVVVYFLMIKPSNTVGDWGEKTR